MTTSVSRSSSSTTRASNSLPVSAPVNASTVVPGADKTKTSAPAQLGHSNRSTFTGASRTPAATGSLRPGARGESVRSLQDKLKAAGFNPGQSDGVYGPRTESAVRDFQRAKGLQVDGIAGRRTFAALNGAKGSGGTNPTPPPAGNGVNGTARLDHQPNGQGMTTGSITVNGHSYQFNSGGGSRFSTPQGTYRVTAHRDSRSDAGFVRDGVGFSFRLEDARRPGSDAMYDSRAGRDRTALRIHPDGGATGTSGCIGLVGNAATLRQFRDDMNAELRRNGGAYTLTVR